MVPTKTVLAIAVACFSVAAAPRPAPAQAVPDFIEIGKTYLFGVFGMMDPDASAEVLEIGRGSWIKVRSEEMDQPIWLNLDVVAMVVEMTPEVEAYMDEQRRAVRDRAYEAAMKSDLRNLVVAQESYFVDHATYAERSALPRAYFVPTTGVTIETIAVGATGWSGLARHESSDSVCYIFVGGAEPPVDDMDEGVPVCR